MILSICNPKLGWNHATDYEVGTIQVANDIINEKLKDNSNLKFNIEYKGKLYFYDKKSKTFKSIVNNLPLKIENN